MLIDAVNNAKNCLETVTLKYFEAGHTYMTADLFHHHVEKEFVRRRCPDEEDRDNVAKKSSSVYDFKDFVK